MPDSCIVQHAERQVFLASIFSVFAGQTAYFSANVRWSGSWLAWDPSASQPGDMTTPAPSSKERPRMLDCASAAAYLGVTERFIRRLRAERRLPYYPPCLSTQVRAPLRRRALR